MRKSFKSFFHSKHHRSEKASPDTLATLLDATPKSLHPNSTTSKAADTDAARISSTDPSPGLPIEAKLPVDGSSSVASKTPLWDQAVFEFREKCGAEYQKLILPAGKTEYEELGLSEGGVEFENSVLNKKLLEAFQEEAGHSNHAIVRRLQSWLPTVRAAKGLTMTLARLDPNQLAPYIVAGSFFAVETLLQIVPADQKEATLEIICDSVIVILKWRSYEENLSSSHQSILDGTAAEAVQLLNGALPDLYATALKLQARIRADTRSRRGFSVAALLGSVEAWKADFAELKRKDRECAARKDTIKDCLDRQDHNSKVLEWIKKKKAPNPQHEEIKKKTGMDQAVYRQAGRWFVESECFKNWITPRTGQPTQKVVWLKGTMGTGKSTLVSQAISWFFEEQDRLPPGNLRVAYYYCSMSTTGGTTVNPDKEIVLRSLCRRLAWQPTERIAKCAEVFYAEFAKENEKTPDWEDLLNRLFADSVTPVILVIDALDECLKVEELLNYLANAVQSRSNLYLLCSSRPHVQVATYFRAAPVEIDTISGKSEPDMDRFIQTTMEERIKSPVTRESIFCGPEGTTLSDDLRRALRNGADGMFRWVEIWFSILFPPDPKSQIVLSDDARDLISQIEKSESSYQDSGHAKLTLAYKQLWKANSTVRHKALQPRLFHLVLSAFDHLTLNQLTEALRIDPEDKKKYQTELQPKHVEWLCHNFLITTPTAGLEWAHQSAKDFVTRQMMECDTPVFSKAANHMYMSRIALQLISQIDHPAWKVGGLDLLCWRQYQSSEQQTAALELDITSMVNTIKKTIERINAEHDVVNTIIDHRLKSLVRNTMLGLGNTSERMQALATLFKAASFASYVVARFMYHLRVVCDTTASISGLQQLLRAMISSPDSALPVVARVVQLFSFTKDQIYSLDGGVNWDVLECFKSAEDFSFYSQLFRHVPIANWRRTSCEVMKKVSSVHGSEAIVAPLKLLTLINTPDKALIEHAVMASNSKLKVVDWTKYPAELMFLACECSCDKTVALFLNHEFFPASGYPTSRTLLQARDEPGALPIHVAVREGSYRVIEELVKSEEREARSFGKEIHVGGGDEIVCDDNYTGLLYVPDGDGNLPIHLAAKKRDSPDIKLIFDLMIDYDAKHATLFPVTPFHPSGTPDSTRKQTSMLLSRNNKGKLPIHRALRKNFVAVQAMLQYEFEAFCSSNQNHQLRSNLLFAPSSTGELLIEYVVKDMGWLFWPETTWRIIRMMLEFEDKWMDLTPSENPGLKRQSELLNTKVFSELVERWEYGFLKPEWLDWLLEKYEVHSSVAVTTSLDRIRKRMETVTVAPKPWDKVALLQKKDDYQMRLLEQLPFEPGYDVDAATVEYLKMKEDIENEWYRVY